MPEESIDTAFDEYCEEWFSGKRPDPNAFCRNHPGCGPELREKIDSFLMVAQGLHKAGHRKHGEEALGALVPGSVIDDFKIVREVGRGGMGIVFEAEQITLSRRVALKVLMPHLAISDDAVRKFHREAEAGGRQSHPGIVSVHAMGEHQGLHYIVQDLVEGGATLAEKLIEIQDEGNLPIGYFRQAAEWIAQVAEALSFAHSTGVIHRDVKPSNILLSREGACKITDFGLAKVEDALALSRTGEFAGTPYYMSPEQTASRKGEIDARTDIFSLGVTLYEAITMKKPFEGETSQQILKGILFDEPRDPRKLNTRIPRDLAVICLKALEKEPGRRYQFMDDFAGDLRRYLSGEVISAKPAGPGVRLWKRIKRYPVASTLLSIAAVAIVGLIGYVLFWSYPHIRSQYREISRLLDIKNLNDLEKEAETLWPAYPEKIPHLESWLSRAEALGSRLEGHRQRLELLRENALHDGKVTFGDEALELQYAMLVDLVEQAKRFLDKYYNSMKERHIFACTVEKRSLIDHRDAWEEVMSSMAGDCYRGIEFTPIIGLVPIGRDPVSGLSEFAHLQTGDIPERDDAGKLEITEKTGLVFVLIPGGSFTMGAQMDNPDGPNFDPSAQKNEFPPHEVSIEPFLLSKFEMTQGQWVRFIGENPSRFKAGVEECGIMTTQLHPVEMITRTKSIKVLARLKLRLPSEKEWEYACRAGTTTPWWTGNEKESLAGSCNIKDRCAEERKLGANWDDWMDDGYAAIAPVGNYRPNAFGLHDTIGNVSEWCQGSYTENYDSEGNARVVCRGGSCSKASINCRSATRLHHMQNWCMGDTGLRPALSLK